MFFTGTLLPPSMEEAIEEDTLALQVPYPERSFWSDPWNLKRDTRSLNPSLILKSWRHVMKILKKTMTSLQQKNRQGHRHKTTLKETGPKVNINKETDPKVKDKISTTKGIGSNIKSSGTQGSTTIKTLTKETSTRTTTTKATNHCISKEPSSIKTTGPSRVMCFKVKDR